MNISLFSAFAVAGLASNDAASAAHIWINEFHYDNPGGDVEEFVEVALSTPNTSGFSASDYVIELYNGNGGALYNTTLDLTDADAISPPIPITGSTDFITLYSFLIPGIQNGAPDGIALVNSTNSTVESFLSYEGTFTATNGTANGLTSLDVGVAEGAIAQTSLSAIGIGSSADEFDNTSFALATTATPGAINQGQVFAVPEPGAVSLFGLAGMLAIVRRRR